MAASANIRRLVSIAYNGACNEPMAASFRTAVQYDSHKPGIIIADEVLAISDIQHTAVGTFCGLRTPETPGFIGSFVVVGQSYINSTGGAGGANLTVTLPTAMAGDSQIDMQMQSVSARYTGASLQPITVA